MDHYFNVHGDPMGGWMDGSWNGWPLAGAAVDRGPWVLRLASDGDRHLSVPSVPSLIHPMGHIHLLLQH